MKKPIEFRQELFKLLRFAATGVVSATVDCVVYYLLLNYTDIDLVLIQPISMSVGLCCSFLFNRVIVFKNEKNSFSAELAKYLVVCFICISLSPVIISIYHIWIGEYGVKIPTTLTTGLLNYLLNRFFVYNDIGITKIYEKIKNLKKDG